MRALHHHPGQPGQRRCRRQPVAAGGQGALPPDLASPRPAAHVMQPRAKTLREQRRLAIPTSCLYSLGDGVVPPQEATIDGDPACTRTSASPAATSAWASTASCWPSSPTAWRSPKAPGSPSTQGLLARVWRATVGGRVAASLSPPPDHRTDHAPTQRKRRRLSFTPTARTPIPTSRCCTSTTSPRRPAAWCASSRS
jgi:hypothetical protein